MPKATDQSFVKEYRRLNPEQRAAVDTIEGPVIVLAGPGTGKTQIVALRVANILRQTQMDPQNILCLTFTESAVQAMRQRLLSIIGQAAYFVRIHTFHSFCNSVIQDNPELFSHSREFLPLTDIERIQLFQALLDELPAGSKLRPFGNTHLFLPDISGAIRTLKQENISSEAYGRIIKALSQFVTGASRHLRPFFKLTPRERTSQPVERLQKQLLEVARAYSAVVRPLSLTAAEELPAEIERLFADYEHALPTVESRSGASQLRTKLKNRLQQWLGSLEKRLTYQQDVQHIYERYQAELHHRGRYDYEDMILLVVNALRTNRDLLAEVQERWQYILVDEYQDTNGAQNELLRLLASNQVSPNIFVVGDDHQSIFRFQGANLENLVDFYERYKSTVQVVTLRHNYRSPQTILDAAHHVISHNLASLEQYVPRPRLALRAALKRRPVPILVRGLPSEIAEDFWIVQEIERLMSQGVEPAEIAVLYRYHADGERLREFLIKRGIPFQVAGGDDVFKQRPIQHLLLLLQYVVAVEREDLLATILHYDFWGADPLDLLKVIHYAGTKRLAVVDVLADPKALRHARVSDPAVLRAIVDKLARWRKASHTESIQNVVALVLQESGLLQILLEMSDAVTTLHYMNTLFGEIKRLNRLYPELTLSQLLDHLKLLQQYNIALEAELPALEQGAVRLMTAHRAKGLEFEHVFVMRLNDGHWGNVRRRSRLSLPPGIGRHYVVALERNEDERRLFYVAITRAKSHLYLTRARQDETGKEYIPSIFLEEVPVEYRDGVGEVALDSATINTLEKLTVQPLPTNQTSALRDWLQNILQHYVMSVTHLNAYLECPRKFYFRHLLRVPIVKDKYLAFGTAVHSALYDLFTGKMKPNRRTAEWLVKRFDHYLVREPLSLTDRTHTQQLGRLVLPAWFERYRREFTTTAMTEYNFGSHRIYSGDLPLTGLIDKVEVLDAKAKAVNVVDYKTGNPDAKGAALRKDGEYYRQLVFYKLLADRSSRFPYTVVSGEIDFIQPSKRTGSFVKKRYDLSEAEVAALEELIQTTWKDIKALRFLDPDVGCGECEYCTGYTIR
jgi:DNA helicase-2/ATP-dependent DNA helicase PcrA